jgi:hypothetical protein
MPSVHDGFDTAKNSAPMTIRAFTPRELAFWAQYGITPDVLSRYHVVAVQQYRGTGKTGKAYELNASSEAPIFGYQGKRFTKLYLPNSETRFLYTGDVTENYVFGLEQLPLRGNILFITGGEKDVLSLASHGFHAICFEQRDGQYPQKLAPQSGVPVPACGTALRHRPNGAFSYEQIRQGAQ